MLQQQEKLRKGSEGAGVLVNGKDGDKIEMAVDGLADANHNADGKLISDLVFNSCV